MSPYTSLLRWCAAATFLLTVASCAQRPGPDDWYRVDPLFTSANTDAVDRDGAVNPYRFKFAEQRDREKGNTQNSNPQHSVNTSRPPATNASLTHDQSKPPANPSSDTSRSLSLVTPAAHTTADATVVALSPSAEHSASEPLQPDAQKAAWNNLRSIAEFYKIQPTEANRAAAQQLFTDFVVAQRARGAEDALRSTSTAYAAAQAHIFHRNRYIAFLIGQSDAIVGGHIASIIGTQNAFELGFGTTSLVTSALATAFTPPGTKTALSAASAISSGMRTSVRETVYSNAFGWAIAEAIIEERSKFLTDVILTKAATLDASTYTIDHAIADIQIYHDKGSFYNGMIEINKRIAAGDRRGRVPASVALPQITVPKELAADKQARDVEFRVEFTTVGSQAFKILFENIESVSLASPTEQLVVATAKDKEFEIRLAGATTFKGKAVYLDSQKPDSGFLPIIIQADDAKFTRYVIPVKIK